MAYMQWTHDLETGIHVIDVQHRRIVDYINELDHANGTGNADQVKHVLEELVDYTVTHFQFEEELQERANYPFLKAHKKVHEIFKRRIATFLERANKGENVVPELMSMLRVWLSSHIKGDDSDYVDSVKMMLGGSQQENESWLASTLHRLFGTHVPVSGSHV